MYRERPLTAGERRFLLVCLSALPAVYIGFYAGLFAADIGSHGELAFVLVRALICAAPPALVAVLAPRTWVLPSLAYGYGFYCGYTFLDGIGALLISLLAAPFAALAGQPLGAPSQPTHPELPWLFLFTIGVAMFVSLLRRHHSHRNESA